MYFPLHSSLLFWSEEVEIRRTLIWFKKKRIHDQVTSPLFREYAWFQRIIGIIIRLFDLWHYIKPYYSLTLYMIPLHAGPFKMSKFVGLFAILNKYSATMKASMHCSHPILKTLGLLFDRWCCCLFNVKIVYFWMRITEFSTANLHLILVSKSRWGVLRRISQLKFLLTHPDFLPSRHSWNFPGSAVSVELPQSSLLCFTQCDPDIITLLVTGAFAQVYRPRGRQTNRQVDLKVVIVDGVLD